MKSDRELLREYAENNDQTAFAVFVERHYGMVHRVARRALSDSSDADDVAIRTFNLLAEQAAKLANPDNAAAWLYGVARRQSLKELRHRCRGRDREKQYGDAMLDEKSSDVLSERELRELRVVFDDVLGELPENQRHAVIYRYLEGHSQKEAASIAGCPQGTLGRWASEGLKSLRGLLTKRGVTLTAPVLLSWLGLEAEAANAVPVPENLISQLNISRSLSQTTNGTKGAWKKMLSTKTIIIGSLAILLLVFTSNLLIKSNSPNLSQKPLKITSKNPKTSKNGLSKRKSVRNSRKSQFADTKNGKFVMRTQSQDLAASNDDDILFTIYLHSDELIEADLILLRKYLDADYPKAKLDVGNSRKNSKEYLNPEAMMIPEGAGFFKIKNILKNPARVIIKSEDLGCGSELPRLLKFMNIIVKVKGYMPSSSYKIEMEDDKLKDIHVNLKKGPKFIGLVVDESGKPLSGIKVICTGRIPKIGETILIAGSFDSRTEDFNRPTKTTQSDGLFQFNSFNYGELGFYLQHPDAIKGKGFRIDFNEQLELPYRFVIQIPDKHGTSIICRCVDMNNKPISGIAYELSRDIDIHAWPGRSDENGLIEITGLKEGVYTLMFGPNGIYTAYPIGDEAYNYPYCAKPLLEIELSDGEKVDFGDIVFRPGRKMKGQAICESDDRITKLLAICKIKHLKEEDYEEIDRKFGIIERRNPLSLGIVHEYLEDLRRSKLYRYRQIMPFLNRIKNDYCNGKGAVLDESGNFEMDHLMDSKYIFFAYSNSKVFYCPELIGPSDNKQTLILKPVPQITCKGALMDENGTFFDQVKFAWRINKQGTENHSTSATGEFSVSLSLNSIFYISLSEKDENNGAMWITFSVPGYESHAVEFNCKDVDENLVYDLGEIVLRKKDVKIED